MPATLWMAGTRGREYQVSRFSPSLEGGNRQMTVEIDVANADNRLLPGMTGEVKLPLQKTSPDSLIVPNASVITLGRVPGQGVISGVYVVRDGKAYRKQVTVSSQDSDNAEITTGIQASDLVITDSQRVFLDGTPVKIEKAP
jgi:membrane fusion protein (multidrug efflux system)